MEASSQNLSNHTYTSSAKDIEKIIHGDTVYCLVPRLCRESFAITVPNSTNKETISKTVIDTLERQIPNCCIYILSFDIINETAETISYNVIFLQILKELINKLFLAEIKIVNFYVGYSENAKEYPLLNSPPSEKHIAKCNKKNIKMPWLAVIKLTKSVNL